MILKLFFFGGHMKGLKDQKMNKLMQDKLILPSHQEELDTNPLG